MKNYILKFGSLAGLILAIFLAIGPISVNEDSNHLWLMILGFGGMTIAFSLSYFAVKAYRDKELNGRISFWKAFLTAFSITLFASIFYVITWAVYVYGFNPDWGIKYTEVAKKEIQMKENLDEESKEKEIHDLEESMKDYKDPFYFSLITFSEPMAPALIISLIVAFATNRKKEE